MDKKVIKSLLMQKDKEYLSELITMLLYKLDDNKRMDFTAKYINAKVVLTEISELGNNEFLSEIKDFCEACLDGQYYVEADYDDWHDDYNEDDYRNSSWSKEFEKYFRLSAVHARNEEIAVGYEALIMLFECIAAAENDSELLGAGEPLEYIDIDASDTLEALFEVILKHKKDDITSAYEEIFMKWLLFRSYCKMSMSAYITDLSAAINTLKNISNLNFSDSEKLFLLIKSLHEEAGVGFDGLSIALELLKSEPNYSLYAAQGYFVNQEWEKAIEIASKYSNKLIHEHYYGSRNILKELQDILVSAYENNGQIDKAYKTAFEMFKKYKYFDLYKRTRFLAEKIMNIDDFIDETETLVSGHKDDGLYNHNRDNKLLLFKILSFEGRRQKLIDNAPKELGNYRSWDNGYSHIKYIVMSLIYSCLGSNYNGSEEDGLDYGLSNLSEFIQGIKKANHEGISDMFCFEKVPEKQEYYLSSAVSVLQLMISFHIGGAERKAYTKAAYYAGIFDNICEILGKSGESEEFIQTLMKENNRRPAFKEEMRKKFKNI